MLDDNEVKSAFDDNLIKSKLGVMNLKKVAEGAGLHRQTLYNWLSDRNDIHDNTRVKIMNYLL